METSPAKLAALAACVASTPWWVEALQNVNLVASTIAGVTGAVVGVAALWRLWKRRQI